MAIGRPYNLTPNIATKNISVVATADQTDFTVTGGYRVNEIGVYRNGVRLVAGRDYSAEDGASVSLVSAATVGDILEFAGIEKFAKTPVKRYSSGMVVRLGFSVAAFLDSDILLVDEVLAVGDARFQSKAISKMDDISKNYNKTVVFVSDNME